MKTSMNHSHLFLILLAVTLTVTSAFSKENPDAPEFEIAMERTENGVKLLGHKGTAFKQLEFTLRNTGKKDIDEFGMAGKNPKQNRRDNNLSDFEFSIKKSGQTYTLIGKKGTAWTTLTFTFHGGSVAVINESGVTIK